MATTNDRLCELLRKYLAEGLGEDELAELRSYDEATVAQLLGELLDADDTRLVAPDGLRVPSERMYRGVIRRAAAAGKRIPGMRRLNGRRLTGWLSGAAAMLCAGVLVVHEYAYKAHPGQQETALHADRAIVPGGNKATLTLPDGQSIVLQEDQSGIVVGAETITYQDGSTLADQRSLTANDRSLEYGTFAVPKGGTYQITLSDGTAVWLNSDSELRYPQRFGPEERVVYLEGEAFFDVAKQNKPFRVVTRQQTVDVFGTQFNLTAYPNEHAEQTTLVNGKIRVTHAGSHESATLVPGQQSTVTGNRMMVKTVDVAPFVAWKEGYFAFSNVHISEALKPIARWYDIEFETQGNLADCYFGGTISRFEDFETLLQTIALTGSVKFDIQGRRIIVMK